MKHYPSAKLHALASAIFAAAGSAPTEAKLVADHLVDANLVGHDSHGVIRVLAYIKAVRKGTFAANQHVSVLRENPVMAALDGNLGYGPVIAAEAVDMALEKAKPFGLSLVALRRAGHVGRVGCWSERVCAAGKAALIFVNAPRPGGALITPFGGSDRRLGASPMSFGWPVPGQAPIVMDISTSTYALGKVRVARNKGELLPDAAIISAGGELTRDPNALFGPPPGAMLPFGGHKGYALNIFTDLLGGLLTQGGTKYPGGEADEQGGNNVLFVVIDPAMVSDPSWIAPELAHYMSWVKASPPLKAGGEVLLPGEPEARSRARRSAEGVPLDERTLAQVFEAGEMVGLARAAMEAMLA